MSKKRKLSGKKVSFQDLLKLAEQNDKDGLKAAFETEGFDINMTDSNGKTLLHHVVKYNQNFDIVRLITRHPQININAKDKRLSTPLMNSFELSKACILKHLLRKGADASCADINGHTALTKAMEFDYFECAKVLVKTKNCSPNAKGYTGRNALMGAIQANDIELMNELFKVTDLTQTSFEGNTILHYARRLDVVKLIVEKGVVDINARGYNGETALHFALSRSSLDIADYLIENGAKPSVQAYFNSESVYDFAAEYDNSETFLEKYEPDEPQLSAMFKKLIRHSRNKTLRAYAEKSINCSKKYPNGPKILIEAVLSAYSTYYAPEIESLLSPLHEERLKLETTTAKIKKIKSDMFANAVKRGNIFVVDYFLERGWDPNEAKRGNSYLIQAFESHCMDTDNVIKSLLKYGANPFVKDKKGRSPLHLSAYYGYNEAFFELLKVDKDLSQKCIKGFTPFLAACKSRSEEIVSVLIEAGASVTDVDKMKWNCLHFAVYKTYYSSEFLLFLHRKLDKQNFDKMLIASNAHGRRPVDLMFSSYESEKNAEILAAIPYLINLIKTPIGIRIKDSRQEMCLICRDDFVKEDMAVILPCKHVYHKNCYREWGNQQKICPY